MRKALILMLLVAVLGSAVLTWRHYSDPYRGYWRNVDSPLDVLQIEALRWWDWQRQAYRVRTADGTVVLRRETDRLRGAPGVSTLELRHDPERDELQYPIFSDTVRRYRRSSAADTGHNAP